VAVSVLSSGMLVVTRNRWSLRSNFLGLIVGSGVHDNDNSMLWLVLWTVSGEHTKLDWHVDDALTPVVEETIEMIKKRGHHFR